MLSVEAAVEALEAVGEVGERREAERGDRHRGAQRHLLGVRAVEQPPQLDRQHGVHVEDAGVADQEPRVGQDGAVLRVERQRAAEPRHGLERRVAAEARELAIRHVREIEGDSAPRGARSSPVIVRSSDATFRR